MVSRSEQGFTIMEILIAAAILVVVFAGVIMLILGSQTLALDTELAHEGQLIAQRHLEQARRDAQVDFVSNQDLSTTVDSDGFIYNVVVTDSPSLCFKTLTVRVDWTHDTRAQHVELASRVANPSEAFSTNTNCPSSEPPGVNPWDVCASDQSADINPSGSQGRDIDVFTIGGTKYMAIVSEHSDDTSHDFWLYQVNSGGFSYVHSMDLTEKEGLSAVTVANVGGTYYAFLAKNNEPQASNKDQLRIVNIDIADPSNMMQVGQLQINGNNDAKDVLYYNGFIYLASGNSLHKVTISDPANPTAVSVNLSASINKLFGADGNIFVASSDNNAELKVVDASTLAALGSFDATGNTDGTAVYVAGGKAYLGREQSNSNPDLHVLDISSVASISQLGSKNLNHTAQSEIVDIVTVGNLAFIGSTKEEFEVWQVADPTNIYKLCEPTNTVAQQAAGLDYVDNVVYGAIRSNQAVRRYIDSNNPPN